MKKMYKLIFACLGVLIFTATVHSAELMGVDVHGFISQGYLKSSDYNYHADTEDGTFEFNEFGINFNKDLTDKLHIGLQLFARDFGKTGNNDIELDWAYGDYRWKDWLGFRAGKIKMPHGLYNESRDIDALRTWIFLPASVYPETLRDLNLSLMGAGIYGNVDMGVFGGLSYQILGGTVNLDDDDSRLSYHLRASSENTTNLEANDITVDSRYAMGLIWDTPLDGLRLGGTYNETELTTESTTVLPDMYGGGSLNIYADFNCIRNTVGSIEYTWNDLLLVAEYIRTKYDYEVTNDRNLPFIAGNASQESDGWYLGAAYRFTDWFEIGGYYSDLCSNVDDRNGTNSRRYDPSHRAWLEDTCLTVRFDINEYMSIKLEGHALEGTTSLYPVDNIPDTGEEWFDKGESWYLMAAKVTFTF